MATVARISGPEGALKSPYEADEDAVIREAEDFTISITTISQQAYTHYTDYYAAKDYGNNYFALLSRVGVGNQEKPTTKVHYLTHVDQLAGPVRDLWADQVCVVEDYREKGENNRIYLSFHCFCQSLGGATSDGLKGALSQIARVAGSIFPILSPYTSFGSMAVEGVNNLLKKVKDVPQEVKTVEFSLFPVLDENTQFSGDAPLQSGSYILFFEEVDITDLYLEEDGTIATPTGKAVEAYLVVNIKKGIYLSPAQLNTNAATEVLESFNAGLGYPLPTQKEPSLRYFDALQELGKSYRTAKHLKRYFELKSKQKSGALTPAESDKMHDLAQEIKTEMPDLPAPLA